MQLVKQSREKMTGEPLNLFEFGCYVESLLLVSVYRVLAQ